MRERFDFGAVARRLAADPTPAGIERELRRAYTAGERGLLDAAREEAAKRPPKPPPSWVEQMPDGVPLIFDGDWKEEK